MRTGDLKFALIALAAVTVIGPQIGHGQTDLETHAASALFGEYETVAYAKTGFLFGPGAMDHLRAPFVALLGGLNSLGPNAVNDLANSYGSILVGAKDFGAADVLESKYGLGAISSHRCYIGVLGPKTLLGLDRDFRKATLESIDGRQVWTWKSTPSEESQSIRYYAAKVTNSFLVVANNREDFRMMAKTLSSADSQSAGTRVSGWTLLSRYDYWAYRALRRGPGVDQEVAGIKELPQDVFAITFFADVGKREAFIQVSSSDKSMTTKPKVLPSTELNLLHPLRPGIWEATIPLSKDEAAFDALFQVFHFLGFGAVL